TCAVLVVAATVGSACKSHQDSVCQDIGDCTQGGSSTWIEGCQSELSTLAEEANKVGCSQAFSAYFSCADSQYVCRGATALFPGCEQRLTDLDTCFGTATAGTSCARLAEQEKACGTTSADGGSPLPAPACTAARACQANCYLTNASNPCAPRVDELETITSCAGQCPP